VKQTYAMGLASFMHWLEAHPQLPTVLSYYMQLGVNIFLASTFVYIVWGAWAAVLADVDIESQKHMSVVMVEIANCAKQYTANRCRPDERVPAMEKLCGTWETCMNRDPQKVARASVTAKTFAMIFNSFVEEFSYKSMVSLALFIFLWVWANVQMARLSRWSEHWEYEHKYFRPRARHHNPSTRPPTQQHMHTTYELEELSSRPVLPSAQQQHIHNTYEIKDFEELPGAPPFKQLC
jgi:hypothetical protein